MELFLDMCSNLWILLMNSFATIKYFIFGFPYVRFAIILITAYLIYKMSSYEYETIKDPYTKAGRRRI
jgi:hypothetical protein